MTEKKLKIHGRVQGVFFRSQTRNKAEELGLKGWVRNEPDGTVTVLIQGEKDQVEKLINWCRQGPDSADVNNIEITTNPSPSKSFKNFIIKY